MQMPTTRLNHSCHVLQTYVHFSSFFILLTVVAAIREYDAKLLLSYWLTRVPTIDSSIQLGASATPALPRVAQVLFDEETKQTTGLAELPAWTRESGVKLVAKPDQLIKRRGKSGLLALNKTWDEARAWIAPRAGKPQKVESVTGVLRSFLVEPFVPHPPNTEYYINIHSVREVRDGCMTGAVGASARR